MAARDGGRSGLDGDGAGVLLLLMALARSGDGDRRADDGYGVGGEAV